MSSLTISNHLAISLRNVHKSYKLFGSQRDQFVSALGLERFGLKPKNPVREFDALTDVSLEVPKGQRIGIIGRNGAGKTTLLKLISGNFAPTMGSVQVNGNVQALMSIGLGFHPEYTGIENIKASLQYSGLEPDEHQKAIDGIIDFCELGQFLGQPFKTYSLGMQSRLQFACSTAIKPSILIVDEILGAGDAYFSVKSSERMEELTHSGVTLILVSHAMSQILQFCERVIWIDGGQVRRDGPARSVVGEYEVFMSRIAKGLHKSKNSLPSPSEGQSKEGVHEFLIELEDGKSAFRWASDEGVKLLEFGLFDDKGTETKFVFENQDFYFEFKVKCETVREIDVIFYVNVVNSLGVRVSRITSETYTLSDLQTKSFRLTLSPNLFGAGSYYINFLAVPGDSMSCGMPLIRYDLVARFCDFEVGKMLDYREPAIFYHPAAWEGLKNE
jgi:lipopolysaccharide transport system ATP-binding protein